ncbi:MAG: glycosyltransferase family 2 protein [Terracidiphilus sp.]
MTVTYNSGSVLPQFLECVFKQTHRDFILFVVDNASKDDTRRLLHKCEDERLRIVANPYNLGVAEGNNQGIRAALEAGCSCVLLINNDTEFNEDLFACLYVGLEENHCDMTTGKVFYFEPSDLIWCAGGWLDRKRLFCNFHYGKDEKDIGQYDEARRVTYAPTCCLLVRRSVFDRIGMMDSKYFVYNDDVDFLYRCLKQDISLWYVPYAKLYHKVSSLTGGDDSEFAIRYMTRNRMYFLRKHLPVWQVLLWGVHFLGYTAPRRLLLGHDSIRIWHLRCASVFEGLRLAHE